MFGERSGSGSERNDDPGVEQVSERERAYLGSVKAAAIARPEDARENDRNTSDKPARAQHQRLRTDHRHGHHPLLQFEFERAARAIARNGANGDERQKEGRCDLIGAEGWSDDAVEREERVGKSRRSVALSARFRIRADRADEGYAHQRTDQRQHHPP